MPTYKTVIAGQLRTFKHDNMELLLVQIRDFYKGLNINFDKEELRSQIERQSRVAPTTTNTQYTRKIGIAAAFQGAKAILNLAAGKSCSAEEILRRSAICETCPMRKNTSGCTSCGAGKNVMNIVNSVQKLKGTPILIPSSVKSAYCGVCECSLAVMIPTRYAEFYVEKKELNQQRPQCCWLCRTSPNFTTE